ncbi:MAG: hypothetical protein ACJAVZ_001279 [Afipia broomeae]|jgi:hypothetical protein
MRPAVESVPSTHPESAPAKRGATTAKTSAMEPSASKTASTAMEAAASAAVPSASCRGGVISRDKEQRAENQRKERNELRPADRHGTLRYNGPQEPHARVPPGQSLNQFIE